MSDTEPEQSTHKKALKTTLLVFGEVLFDGFPDGKRVLGGAPFNVAWGLQGLGQQPLFVSAVGDDPDGVAIRERMEAWGMTTAGLQTDAGSATGEVKVRIVDDEPDYTIFEDRAWDRIGDRGQEASGLIYHGLLGLRSASNQKAFDAIMRRSRAKRFFDVNLRPPYDSLEQARHWMEGVDWLKLNLAELSKFAAKALDFEACDDAVQSLRRAHGIGHVLLTGGSEGARIIGPDERVACSPAPEPAHFVDTVGAGDAFAAYTIHGILEGRSLEQIVCQASQFAAKVCGLRGATTPDPNFYH